MLSTSKHLVLQTDISRAMDIPQSKKRRSAQMPPLKFTSQSLGCLHFGNEMDSPQGGRAGREEDGFLKSEAGSPHLDSPGSTPRNTLCAKKLLFAEFLSSFGKERGSYTKQYFTYMHKCTKQCITKI
ncbi:hypothetical protein CDAR_236241 [Caerostris darwini]|uniref:Uncharacterized protein n=1 Tax=Caerostris darwini TaxID=1538125 RepID=A0AAV4TBQ7_9ARAC|nr:hypothetical protein CDAR_236241 [Caerostris darwini]